MFFWISFCSHSEFIKINFILTFISFCSHFRDDLWFLDLPSSRPSPAPIQRPANPLQTFPTEPERSERSGLQHAAFEGRQNSSTKSSKVSPKVSSAFCSNDCRRLPNKTGICWVIVLIVVVVSCSTSTKKANRVWQNRKIVKVQNILYYRSSNNF